MREPGKVGPWGGPSPKVSEVVKAILEDPDVGRCRWMPGGELMNPGELWLPEIGVWVRCDGRYYNGDYGRDTVFPSWIGRLRIRMAVRQREKYGRIG